MNRCFAALSLLFGIVGILVALNFMSFQNISAMTSYVPSVIKECDYR